MSRQVGALAWIAKGDLAQHEWALRYLYKKRIDVSQLKSYADLVSWEPGLLGSSEGRELVRKMRSAWAQREFRERDNGKKSYNFVLSISVKKKLDELAKRNRLGVGDYLGVLISNALDLQKNFDTKLKEIKKDKDESLMTKADDNQRAASALGRMVGSVLMELSECEVQHAKQDLAGEVGQQPLVAGELFKKKKNEMLAEYPLTDSLKLKNLIKTPDKRPGCSE